MKPSVSAPSTRASSTTANVNVTVDEPALNVTVFVPFQVPPAATGPVTSAATDEPPLVTVTLSGLVVGPVRVNVTTTAAPPSAPLVALTETSGTSLSVMFAFAADGEPSV